MRRNKGGFAAMLVASMFAGAGVGAVGTHSNATVNGKAHAVEVPQTHVERKKKRTPLGTEIAAPMKHQFPMVPQKHKKHTNRNHIKAKHRRKRIRKSRKR